jgi:hypothetical protein
MDSSQTMTIISTTSLFDTLIVIRSREKTTQSIHRLVDCVVGRYLFAIVVNRRIHVLD